MKQQKIKSKNKAGFTMVEVIIIVSVLAVLTGIASFIMGDTVNAAKDNTRKTNAILMNKQISQIRALGGKVGEGSENDVDMTDIKTVINCLTATPPLKVAEITFSLDPKPVADEYTLDEHKVIKAVLTQKDDNAK